MARSRYRRRRNCRGGINSTLPPPRGEAGYRQNTHDFAKFIWHQASPRWTFTDATFANSAKALDNPDHVAVTISNYRWRPGLEQGEAKYAAYEQRLAKLPAISVPTITIEGKTMARRIRRRIAIERNSPVNMSIGIFKGAVGHNPPQEAPAEFVQAVIDADRL